MWTDDVSKGDLVTVPGSPAVWVVVSTGPYWIKVRNADLSASQKPIVVSGVKPYDPSVR